MTSSSSKSEDISPHSVVASCAINNGDANNLQINTNNTTQQQQDNNNSNNDLLPIEYQLYKVDLTNPDMDPLEYTFRKYVPIPKVYFWESNATNEYNQSLPIRIKAWHNTIYYLGLALRKAENGGEVIANLLGLNEGPFNYVTDRMTEEQMASSQRRLDEQSSSSSVGEDQQKKDDNDDVGV